VQYSPPHRKEPRHHPRHRDLDRWLDWWGWIPSFLFLCVLSDPPAWLYQALGVFGACCGVAALMVVLARSPRRPLRAYLEALRRASAPSAPGDLAVAL